jgi:hypothetical protein
MQSLIGQYMRLKDREKFESTVFTKGDSSVSSQMDDSFRKHFVGGGKKGTVNHRETKAYRIPGTRISDNRMYLIEGAMSAKAVLEEAHKYNATLSAYLTSLYMLAISKEMRARGKKYPVVLTVPVNLRQYYESETARNFFSYINMRFRFCSGTVDFNAVLEHVRECFKKELTVERLDNQLNRYMSIERNLFARIVPLPIKDLVARLAVSKAMRETTSTLSNIGVISMPTEFQHVIRQFSICTSAQRLQMTMCSYGDRLVVSMTSPYREIDIQRTFFQMLSKLGVDIEISSCI